MKTTVAWRVRFRCCPPLHSPHTPPAFILSSCNKLALGIVGSTRAFGERIICGFSTLTTRAAWNYGAIKEVCPGPASPKTELMSAATKQIRRYLIDHGRALSSVIGAETAFSFDLDGHIILGKIDLMKRYSGDSIELIDFKTSKMPEPDKDIRKEIIDLQLVPLQSMFSSISWVPSETFMQSFSQIKFWENSSGKGTRYLCFGCRKCPSP
jgi:hypothetical protein